MAIFGIQFFQLSLPEIFHQFITEIRQTTWLEFIAVISGIASVWFSRAENILVYPVGLVNTIVYIFLSVKGHLFGEASVNLYYTIMSVYGWILWAKSGRTAGPIAKVRSSRTDRLSDHRKSVVCKCASSFLLALELHLGSFVERHDRRASALLPEYNSTVLDRAL